MNHRPKKSLGQNFLKNQGIIEKIAAAASLDSRDLVLEIGPGLGALTEKLIPQAGSVVAIEKDDSLIGVLQEKFASEIEQGKFHIINGDVLDFDPEILHTYSNKDLKQDTYKLVANIPYYITGAIIEKFLSVKFQPSMMVLLVQKEVAERIVAKDKKTGGSGKESILSIAVKAYGDPYYVGTVRAGSFVPAPSIDSAIIKIENISRNHFKNAHHEQVFFQVMKAGFAHKRKTLAGNLKNILEPEIVERSVLGAGLAIGVRAEDVGISSWRTLATLVYNAQYES